MLKEKLEKIVNWKPPLLGDEMIFGDMPGDKIKIGEDHLLKAEKIFPILVEELKNYDNKVVVSVFGGSGVGKSEIASLLANYLIKENIKSYIISGDNYPRRIPLYNDAERLSVFRANGLRGLLDSGCYNEEVQKKLEEYWQKETDCDPETVLESSWLKYYQKAGRDALTKYLGTCKEQNYDEINDIIAKFRDGKEKIWLKRMGRTEEARWYSEIDFSDIEVLFIEWTHGGSIYLEGIDIPILLNSTPQETKEHRRLRARDGKTDSAFTTMVLEIEQAKLDSVAKNAKIIISKTNKLLNAEDF